VVRAAGAEEERPEGQVAEGSRETPSLLHSLISISLLLLGIEEPDSVAVFWSFIKCQ